jgi:hypothetical protein
MWWCDILALVREGGNVRSRGHHVEVNREAERPLRGLTVPVGDTMHWGARILSRSQGVADKCRFLGSDISASRRPEPSQT